MPQTMRDRVADARALPAGDLLDTAIREALGAAERAHELRELLLGAAAMPGVRDADVAEIAQRTLAASIAEREIWGFHDVAAARVGRLGDDAGARAALDACFATLSAERDDVTARVAKLSGRPTPTHGYEWVLAADFSQVVADTAGSRRCLEAGLATARSQANADDLVAIAVGWHKHLDRETSRALLQEAETLATNGSVKPWTLANAWKAMGDDDAVARVLDGALAVATASHDAIHVAQAWASHDESGRAAAALEHATALAESAQDHLEIAELAFEAKLGADRVRGALDRALSLVTDDTRMPLANAYARWLRDEAAADRVGSRGAAPGASRTKQRSLADWHVSASALVDWLRARMPRETLREIASADYGHAFDQHLAALNDICRTGRLPRHLPWYPHEVLALTRWSDGNGVNHQARAFACALLVLASPESDELVDNGIRLAESAIALGPEASAHAVAFFAWCFETADEPLPENQEDSEPTPTIALLLLFIIAVGQAPDDPRLEALAGRLVDRDDLARHRLRCWLRNQGQSAKTWRELTLRTLGAASAPACARRVLDVLGYRA